MKTDFGNYKRVVERWIKKAYKNKSRPEYMQDLLATKAKKGLSLLNNPHSISRSDLYKEIRHYYYTDEFDKIEELLSNEDLVIRLTFSERIIAKHIEDDLIQSQTKLGRVIYKFQDARVKSELIDSIKTLIKLEEIEKLSKKILLEREKGKRQEDEIEDWSSAKANEKILFLDQLGLLQILRKSQPFNTSSNKLATLLSAITGEKVGTLQSCLSGMATKNKNNPYNSVKLVAKVKAKLDSVQFQQNQSITTLLGKK